VEEGEGVLAQAREEYLCRRILLLLALERSWRMIWRQMIRIII
jgi:hypothetical protein